MIHRGRNFGQPLATHFIFGGIRNKKRITKLIILWRHVTKVANEYFLTTMQHDSKMDLDREAKQIRRSPTPLCWVRLNTDEASKNGLIARFGSLLRSCTSEWLGDFTRYLGSCNVYIAELLGHVRRIKIKKRF